MPQSLCAVAVPPQARAPGAPPWYETREFRALIEVYRTFVKGGIPPAAARTPEAGARQAAFWTLYSLGHVLEELALRTRGGMQGWCAVRASELGSGRVVIDLSIQPLPDAPPAERGAP